MITVTPQQLITLRLGDARYNGNLTFRLLVETLGGVNQVYDALLEDALPSTLSEIAHELVDRKELQARANFRLAKALERLERV